MPTIGLIILATPLAALSDAPFTEVLKQALLGTLRNLLPLVVYLIGGAILIFGGAMVLGVGILAGLPVILAAGSAAYRDVYG